jgi:hypothetical protein
MRSFNTLFLALASLVLAVRAAYWMEGIPHQGFAPYAGSGYTVFRNVRDFGAKGILKWPRLCAVIDTYHGDQVTVLQTTQLPSTLPSRLAGTAVGKDVYASAQYLTQKGFS